MDVYLSSKRKDNNGWIVFHRCGVSHSIKVFGDGSILFWDDIVSKILSIYDKENDVFHYDICSREDILAHHLSKVGCKVNKCEIKFL